MNHEKFDDLPHKSKFHIKVSVTKRKKSIYHKSWSESRRKVIELNVMHNP